MMIHKKAIITGATGFIGSHLARRLVKDGWTVTVVIRNSSNCDLICDIKNSIQIYKYDGTIKNMMTIFEKSNPDITFHLASLYLAQHQPEDISKIIESNVIFGTQVVEAAVNVGCLKIVNTGTSWQHYGSESYNPVNLYAATKQAFEDILKFYVESYGLRAINLKIYDTYSDNDPRPKIINLLKSAAGTKKILNMSPGHQKICLVHIDDVINAYCISEKILNEDCCPMMKSYGVCTGKYYSLREIVAELEKSIRKKINVNWGGKKYRNREVMIPCMGIDALPGWEAKKIEIHDIIK